jgi:hypothetical protein
MAMEVSTTIFTTEFMAVEFNGSSATTMAVEVSTTILAGVLTPSMAVKVNVLSAIFNNLSSPQFPLFTKGTVPFGAIYNCRDGSHFVIVFTLPQLGFVQHNFLFD